MPKQNINSIRTYIKVSTLFTMTAKPMHVPGYDIWFKVARIFGVYNGVLA